MTTQIKPSRRDALAGGLSLAVAACWPAAARAGLPGLHVLKDPGCGCCSAWIDILKAEGFTVTAEDATASRLARAKRDSGVPEAMASCHTARIGDYVVEGHVPGADIRRLLDERPDAVGLAVPGMPIGSPGMGPESEREAYEVFLIRRDGSTEVFASYEAA